MTDQLAHSRLNPWPFPIPDTGATAAALVVAGALLWAGTAKAWDLEPLVRALLAYRLATPATADVVAASIATVELVLGASILRPKYRRQALAAAAVLLTVF